MDCDYSIDFSQVTTSEDRVAVITTKPLTDEEGWTEFKRGQLLLFDQGRPYKTPTCCESVERQGRGLFSTAYLKRRSNSVTDDKYMNDCIDDSPVLSSSLPSSSEESLLSSSLPSSSLLSQPLKSIPRRSSSPVISPEQRPAVADAPPFTLDCSMPFEGKRFVTRTS